MTVSNLFFRSPCLATFSVRVGSEKLLDWASCISWKSRFRSFLYSHSVREWENCVKNRPVDVEIIGLTEIVKKTERNTSKTHDCPIRRLPVGQINNILGLRRKNMHNVRHCWVWEWIFFKSVNIWQSYKKERGCLMHFVSCMFLVF